MRNALRPYVVAGVAVVGAGALAIAPVIATPSDVKIVNPDVRHTASAFDVYRDAVEHLLANLEALLGTAVAGPASPGLSLGPALDDLPRVSARDFQSLRDPLVRHVVDLPVLLASMRTESSKVLEAARVDLAAGRIDSAIDRLLSASLDAVVQGVKLVTIPLGALPGSIAEPVARLGSYEISQVLRAVTIPHSDESAAVSLRLEPSES